MSPDPHKLDLARVDCTLFEVFFDLPADHSAIKQIAEHLDERTAVALYRRSHNEHTVLFAQRPGADGSSEYRNTWIASGSEASGFEAHGDPGVALEIAYGAAEHAHIYCLFSPNEGLEPKVTLPISPFASGTLPFNQIQGYRAALVEGEQNTWSAVIDWIKPNQFGVAIHVDKYDLALVKGPNTLLSYCVSIRDSLFVEKSDE